MTLDRARRETLLTAGLVLGVLLLLAATTWRGRVAGDYLVGAALTMALFALFALGLGLQFGFGGLINFGHVAFAAVGAYGIGIAHLQGWPLWAGVAAGLAGAVGLALLLGLPALRLREDYLAIVTIGAAEILRTVLTSEVDVTRGPFGIYGFPRPGLAWATDPAGPWAGFARALGVNPYPLFMLALTLVLGGLTYAAYARLVRSPWGRVLKAIREDEGVAEAVGKDAFRFKLQVLAVGAVPAALFGMLFAWAYAQVVPDNFVPIVTFYAWIIVVLGGVANLKGAVAGSAALWGIFLLAQTAPIASVPVVGPLLAVLGQRGPGQLLLIGLLLIAVMMLRPQGFVGRREEMLFGR